MKVNTWIPKEEPKTKAAALRLAAQISTIADSIERRRNNLMKLEFEHTAKIAKLNAKLENIREELKRINSSEATEYIERLKLKHSLTEAEILETKSELLRRSIESRTQQLSELKQTGTKNSEGNSPQ
jgi:multidrug resistance efflux pump